MPTVRRYFCLLTLAMAAVPTMAQTTRPSPRTAPTVAASRPAKVNADESGG